MTRGANFLDGPVCNGSDIIGWKTREMTRRFHADISGFAFNSTILWDPKRWHRLILEPIRQLDTVKERFVVGLLIFCCIPWKTSNYNHFQWERISNLKVVKLCAC